MIIRSRKDASTLANILQKKLEGARRINLEDRKQTEQDISDLRAYADKGIIPQDKWNNVFLWLTGNKYTTLE